MTATSVEILNGLEWPLVYLQPCPAMTEMEDEQVEQVEIIAAEFLYRWTAQQFGTRQVSATFSEASWTWHYRPSTFEGRGPYSNLISPPTSFRNVNPLKRHGIRVRNLVSVSGMQLDGEPFEHYTVDGNVIYRTDGQTWFTRQDVGLDVTIGAEVPLSGQHATGLLACEFAKAATDDPECQLPARVQSVTREGISVAVMDQFEDLHEGHTGVWMVDQWVASIMHAPRRSAVMSPDYKSRGARLRKTW